jgi:hypothetical protein
MPPLPPAAHATRPRGRRASLRPSLGLGLILLLGGCEPQSTPAPHEARLAAASPTPKASAVDPEELERLRALGYAGVAPALPEGARTGVLHHDRARSAPGLNLFTNANTCTTQLVDMEGNLLHSWSAPSCHRWGNAVLAPDGDLIVIGRTRHAVTNYLQADAARYLMRLKWDGSVRWRKSITSHHDVELGADGELLSLIYRRRIIPEVHPTIPVQDHLVAVIGSDGEIRREVSLYDALTSAPELFSMRRVRPRRAAGVAEVDVIHANALEWVRPTPRQGSHPLYAPGTLLVCMRNQDSVIAIDWKTERLVWAWGQGEVSGPHDATMLENGNLLIFDNGLGRSWSRVIELNPLEGRIVWEYRAPDPRSFHTPTRGSNQRLSNGNTLIVESDAARAFEVTPQGERVWEFLNFNLTVAREPSVIVRMRRYEGLSLADLEAAGRAGRLARRD